MAMVNVDRKAPIQRLKSTGLFQRLAIDRPAPFYTSSRVYTYRFG